MGDSPSLNFMPSFSESYDEDIFTQFANIAYVLSWVLITCVITLFWYRGCQDTTTDLSCLRSVSSETLTLAGSQLLGTRPSTIFVFAPIFDGTFLPKRPVEAFNSGGFAQVPVLFGSNTNEGAHWSAGLSDPNANTSMPNASETTVFNFFQGQYATLQKTPFEKALDLYPLDDYEGSFSLQGQQMYGETRYICTAGMISGFMSKMQKSYRFQWVHNCASSRFEYWACLMQATIILTLAQTTATTSTLFFLRRRVMRTPTMFPSSRRCANTGPRSWLAVYQPQKVALFGR